LSITVLAVTPAATSLKTGFSTGFRIYQNRTLILISKLAATSDPLPAITIRVLSAKKKRLATLMSSTVTALMFLI
jgi:hypothetical protein